MLFIQEYSVNEQGFGRQALRFAVSNIYSELFLANGDAPAGTTFTDIYDIEGHKQDLEMEDGKFGIDELTFEINSLSCKTEADKQAMYFCLDATNVNAVRYCALFFGEEPTAENMLFVGKLNTKISGKDVLWGGTNYSPNIRPERTYKLSAFSFDVSILDECSINGDVYDLESTRIANLRERFFEETLFNTWFKTHSAHRVAYQEWGASKRYIHYTPTINLKTYIGKMLELSSELLQEKYGIVISFNLAESDVGIDVLPSYVSGFETGPEYDHIGMFRSDKWHPYPRRIRLKLSDYLTSTTSPILISQTMIDSRLINDKYVVDEDGIIEFLDVKSPTMDMSFMTKLNTMSELLFTLARDLGCFLILGYSAVDEISVEFVPRGSVVNDGYTYLIDAEQSSFDSSSNRDSGGGTNFYALSSNELDEGADIKRMGGLSSNYVSKYQTKTDELRELKEQRNIDSKKLMLSISPTLQELMRLPGRNDEVAIHAVPLNVVARVATPHIGWKYEGDYEGIYADGATSGAKQIHTGIYIQTDPIEETTPAQPTPITRTAHAIVATVNGIDKVYYKLGDYINDIYKTGQQYYETELQVTVPSWNGFNDSASATGASWNKLKLGSMFKFSEFVKRYDGEAFAELEIDRDYVVVGIERDLSKPETTLKLIDKNAYAFGYPAEIPELIDEAVPMSVVALEQDSEPQKYGYKIIDLDPPHEIARGEEVMILADGTIAKAEADSSYKATGYGTALESGISGETIRIQTDGIVDMPDVYDFTGEITSLLFLRTNEVGSNVSLTPLIEKTVDEDLYCIIGVIDSKTSFKRLNKKWVML